MTSKLKRNDNKLFPVAKGDMRVYAHQLTGFRETRTRFGVGDLGKQIKEYGAQETMTLPRGNQGDHRI
jgi:hypothetical protein